MVNRSKDKSQSPPPLVAKISLYEEELYGETEPVEALLSLVVFSLGDEYYGLEVKQVREVVLMPAVIPLPNLPDHILGIFNLRGNIVSVTDLNLYGSLPPKLKPAIQMMMRTVDRMVRLVTDLLDLAKIEAGKMKLNKEKFDMAELLDETLETYAVLIKEKKLKIGREFPSGENTLVGDRDWITQVVVNVLNNSIKFTPSEGRIIVRLISDDLKFRIEIEDNGPGMDAEGIKKIFDKFERITVEKREGTGLGLPIARDIVILHGGKIWAESEEGKGSKFIVELPLLPPS